jgi:hypothetical protein
MGGSEWMMACLLTGYGAELKNRVLFLPTLLVVLYICKLDAFGAVKSHRLATPVQAECSHTSRQIAQ